MNLSTYIAVLHALYAVYRQDFHLHDEQNDEQNVEATYFSFCINKTCCVHIYYYSLIIEDTLMYHFAMIWVLGAVFYYTEKKTYIIYVYRIPKTTVVRQLRWMHKILFISTEPYSVMYLSVCIFIPYYLTNHQHKNSISIDLPL